MLRERITVIPVMRYQPIQGSSWNGHAKVMLLPKLHGPEDRSWAADFCEPVSVASEELTARNRIAALSNEGALILQQRLIFLHARYAATLDELYTLNAPIFTELELQQDWVEEALEVPPAEADEDAITEQAVKDFHDWLDEDGGARRRKLQIQREHSTLRSDARKECLRRYGPN